MSEIDGLVDEFGDEVKPMLGRKLRHRLGPGRPIAPGSERQRQPWLAHGVTRRTWQRWKKAGRV